MEECKRVVFRPNDLQRKMFERKDDQLLLVRTERGVGKTTGLAHLAFQYGVLKPQQEILVVVPHQCMTVFFGYILRGILEANPHIPIRSSYTKPWRLEFGERSRVAIIPDTANRNIPMCGMGADYILVDEAAALSESMWQCLKPIMVGDRHRGKPTTIIASTPISSTNIFDTYCDKNPECVIYG